MLDSTLTKMKMQILNVNVAQLAEISGVAPNKLSQFINGTRGIRNDEVTRLRNSLSDLEELIQIAQPFPLSFRNTGIIRELILSLKRGELTRAVAENSWRNLPARIGARRFAVLEEAVDDGEEPSASTRSDWPECGEWSRNKNSGETTVKKQLKDYVCLYCSNKFEAEWVKDLRDHDCPDALAADKRLGIKVARFDPVLTAIEERI